MDVSPIDKSHGMIRHFLVLTLSLRKFAHKLRWSHTRSGDPQLTQCPQQDIHDCTSSIIPALK
eukprot:4825022-Amphidinium_carterae.1